MLTQYLSSHLDQAVLGVGLLSFMLWSNKNQQDAKNNFFMLILTIAALCATQRAQSGSAAAYALFLVSHLFFMKHLILYSQRTNELRFYGLIWALSGHLMIEAKDWLGLFIGGELLSLPLYGWFSARVAPKAALRTTQYFMQSALLSALFLVGLSLFYGQTGSLSFGAWEEGLWADLFWVLVLSWFFFKLGVAPFSYWVPQIYDLLEPREILWFSLLPKYAFIAGLAQIISTSWPMETSCIGQKVLVAAIALTAVWGHAGAWASKKWVDFFAYTAIAQNSFVLAALLLGGNGLVLALAVQVTYTFCLGVFFNAKKEHTATYRFGLFNLSALPPTPLFGIKILIAIALIQSGHLGVAAFLLCMSVVALSYYLRVYATKLEGTRIITTA